MKARLDDVLSQLKGVRRSGDGYVALCPAHDDTRQSLSVKEIEEDEVLVHCFAGCEFGEVADCLDLPQISSNGNKSEIIAAYDYHDQHGTLAYQVVRLWPKSFRQRRPDGQGGWEWGLGDTERLPYRLPQVLKAVEKGRRVFVVEGERDVQTLENLGFVATCNSGGAGKWYPNMNKALTGAHVVLLPDNDDVGKKHAEAVKQELAGLAASVRVCYLPDLPPKGDVTNWVRNGGNAEELKRLVLEGSKPHSFTLMDAVKGLERYKTDPMPQGIDYPWAGVQRKTRGLRPGWFIILAGYPGSGKSAASLEIMFSAAKNNKKVLLNSLEMNEQELAIRLAQRWGMDTDRLYRGTLTDEDREAIDSAGNFPYFQNIEFVSEKNAESLRAIIAERQPDLAVIDYIGLMNMHKNTIQEGTAKLSEQFKTMAREFEVPMLVLSQLSRPADKQKVAPPTMFDLRASGHLEADADQVIILFRDDSKDDHEVISEGRFIIAKSRHAKAGKPVKFKFDGERQTFSEVDEAYERALARWGGSEEE